MAKRTRAINYDLDDRLLQENYPNPKSYKNAWRDVKGFLCKHGFEDRQYSGVVSTREFEDREITELFDDLLDEYDWLEPCILKFDVTDITDQHSLIDEWRNIHFIEHTNKIDFDDSMNIINDGHKVLSNDKTNKDTIIDKSSSKNDKSKTK